MLKKTLASFLSIMLVWLSGYVSVLASPPSTSLAEIVKKPYLELLELSPTVRFSVKDVSDLKERLEKEKEQEKKRLKQQEDQLKR
ncbi:MAG: hypothetical protein AB1489_15280 [Acidobacteriota bacterium]